MKNIVLGLFVLWPVTGFAQNTAMTQQDRTDREDVTFSFGLGVVGASGIYIGQDEDLLPFPLLAATYGPLTISTTEGLAYRFWQTETTTLAAALAYNGAPDLPDADLFNNLKRDDWIGGKLSMTHDFGVLDIAVSGQIDVSDVHDGGDAAFSLGRSFIIGKTLVEGRLGVTYLDEKQGSYLYGVARDEANALRPAYSVSESWTPHVDLSVFYPLSDDTSIGGFFRHEELPDNIADSPLVDTGERTTFGLTLVRTF